MKPRPLTGCGTALVTPFAPTGDIDERALRDFVEWQVTQGVHFVVPCGSTGETATMSLEEHERVVAITVDQVAGRVPVVAGAGSNDTKKAIMLTRLVQALGATHALHVSPMYNKPPQRGIEAHFRTISDAVDFPLVVYNVPGRTGSNIEARTALRIAELTNVVAIKEASGNLTQIGDIIRDRPPHFSVLSGDDALTLPVMALGGEGVISVTSNATPRLMADLVEACASGDFVTARLVHRRLQPWMTAAFSESNPIPAKTALGLMGRMAPHVRLPLVPLAPIHEPALREALITAGALP